LNGAHQLLAYADNVNILEYNIDDASEHKESLIDASKRFGLELNVEKK
jgi:hypothetical protein